MKKQMMAAALIAAMTVSMTSMAFAEEAATEASGAAAAATDEIVEVPKDDVTTVADGKLTVATSPDFAPYEFYHIDENGDPQLSGFDIALAQKIADELGLELEVVPMDFDGILMELQSGNVDLGISGFSPSPERAEVFDFSDLYYMGGQSFCVVKDNADKYTDFADFAGLSVGAQTGSIQYELAQENTPDANLVGLAKVTDIVSELITGKLDGAFIETAVAQQYAKSYPELEILWDVPYDTEGSAIAIAKGNDAMTAAVNAVINNVLVDGTMDQYIAEAQELATDEGNVYEGQLNSDGEANTEAAE